MTDLECDEPYDDARGEEDERLDEPNDTPDYENVSNESQYLARKHTLRWAAPADLAERLRVRAIDFSCYCVIHDVPQNVHARHDADEQHLRQA